MEKEHISCDSTVASIGQSRQNNLLTGSILSIHKAPLELVEGGKCGLLFKVLL